MAEVRIELWASELPHWRDLFINSKYFAFCLSRYKEASIPPALWLEQSLLAFRESLLDLCQPNRAPTHQPLERTSPQATNMPASDSNSNMNQSSLAQAAATKQILDNFNKLMTSCVVLRIENFTLYRVTTSGKKEMPKEFISGELSGEFRLFCSHCKCVSISIDRELHENYEIFQ